MDGGKVKREIEKNKAMLLKYNISVDVNSSRTMKLSKMKIKNNPKFDNF